MSNLRSLERRFVVRGLPQEVLIDPNAVQADPDCGECRSLVSRVIDNAEYWSFVIGDWLFVIFLWINLKGMRFELVSRILCLKNNK